MSLRYRALSVLLLLLCLVVAGCEATKTENPLSPSVAGSISGVEIGAPRVLEPSPGAVWILGSGPIALTIENTSSSGQRPLAYSYEVATDAGFGTLHFQEIVAPGNDGRTALTPPGQWTVGATYFWRVRAVDGANTGPYSEIGHFRVLERVVLGLPGLLSPGNGNMVDGLTPQLRLSNAPRTGQPEGLRYEFQVSSSSAFDTVVAGAEAGEQAGSTGAAVGPLAAGRTYFWRARAVEASTAGPWSGVWSFSTRPIVPVPAPPSGIPYGGAGARPGSSEGTAMVSAVISDLRRRGISTQGDCGAFEITRRVAWAFRDRGAGLEVKPGGRNCQSRSIDILVFTDGMSVDILVGAGGDNGPAWQEHPWPQWRESWAPPSNPD